MNGAPAPGLFGKLPWAGDFLREGLPSAFVTPWDGWISHVLAASRAAPRSEWPKAYLLSPPWRFRLDPGLIGETGWTGVIASSVDRVGRHYPLTIAVAFSAAPQPPLEDALLDLVESAALDLIANERPPVDALMLLHMRIRAEAAMGQRHAVSHFVGPLGRNEPARLAIEEAAERIDPRSADAAPSGPRSRWWHRRWQDRPAEALSCHGLPETAAGAGLFDGLWLDHGWRAPADGDGR